MKNWLMKIRAFFYKSRYFWNKFLFMLLTLFLTIVLSFVLIKSLPGDVVHNYALTLQNNLRIEYNEAYKMATQMLNYDPQQGLFQSFLSYSNGLIHGNLGQSIYQKGVSTNSIINQYLPWTLLVSTVSLILSFLIGTTVGIKMAAKRESASETVSTILITIANSIPDYLLGIILLMTFGSTLGIFPTYGAYDLASKGDPLKFTLSILHHAALPIFTFTIAQVANWALLAKGTAVSVMGDDYINAAMARGLPKSVVNNKYLKKNAMLPLIIGFVLSFAYLFGGSSVMESVFAYPGIGRAFVNYIGLRDYFVVQGLFVFMSFIIILSNFLADFIIGLFDPRIRTR